MQSLKIMRVQIKTAKFRVQWTESKTGRGGANSQILPQKQRRCSLPCKSLGLLPVERDVSPAIPHAKNRHSLIVPGIIQDNRKRHWTRGAVLVTTRRALWWVPLALRLLQLATVLSPPSAPSIRTHVACFSFPSIPVLVQPGDLSGIGTRSVAVLRNAFSGRPANLFVVF